MELDRIFSKVSKESMFLIPFLSVISLMYISENKSFKNSLVHVRDKSASELV